MWTYNNPIYRTTSLVLGFRKLFFCSWFTIHRNWLCRWTLISSFQRQLSLQALIGKFIDSTTKREWFSTDLTQPYRDFSTTDLRNKLVHRFCREIFCGEFRARASGSLNDDFSSLAVFMIADCAVLKIAVGRSLTLFIDLRFRVVLGRLSWRHVFRLFDRSRFVVTSCRQASWSLVKK